LISKHVDLIAIALLLSVIGLFSTAKHLVVMTMGGPVHYFRMDNGHQVRVPAVPKVPEMPRIPRIPLQRD
jgi:hypothetical protein